jgi:hypothetical protein
MYVLGFSILKILRAVMELEWKLALPWLGVVFSIGFGWRLYAGGTYTGNRLLAGGYSSGKPR